MNIVMTNGEETRKIQFTGKSTYIISLPKQWIIDLGLKQGDQVTVGRKGISSLQITPYHIRRKDESEIATLEIEPKEETSSVVRKLVSLYFFRFKTINIKPKTGREGISWSLSKNSTNLGGTLNNALAVAWTW